MVKSLNRCSDVIVWTDLYVTPIYRYISLLKTALNPAEAGRGLYFSYGADVTLTQQRYAETQGKGEEAGRFVGERAEPRFLWNRHLLALFLGADLPCTWPSWMVSLPKHDCHM